ncbi:MAG: cellulose synthase catalytic subunit [Proteobacteria bacterium]|nr:cellulose synthase catalytic subunit [Pseudomonadota bacterium]
MFICTYGEPLDVVETTIFGALQVRGRKTVYVLDDGRREQMRQLAESYGVKYITRNDNKHAKAGNLNNALQHTNEEFVAVLDADFIPQPHFLEEAMGYFTDPKVAVVQFPQEFYNIDSTQHVRTKGVFKIWHEQRLFHEVIMPSRNSIGTAFWCGSPSVVRRSALNSIGGVLTGSITEDFETSLALQRKGYRTIFSNKIVAYGLSPHHIFGFRIQRARWGAGTVRNLFSSRSPLFSMNLNIFQKLSFFSGHHYYLSCYTRFYFLILPLLIHYFGQTQGEGMLTFLWMENIHVGKIRGKIQLFKDGARSFIQYFNTAV